MQLLPQSCHPKHRSTKQGKYAAQMVIFVTIILFLFCPIEGEKHFHQPLDVQRRAGRNSKDSTPSMQATKQREMIEPGLA